MMLPLIFIVVEPFCKEAKIFIQNLKCGSLLLFNNMELFFKLPLRHILSLL